MFISSVAVESILVKLETSRTVILPPIVSVLWSSNHSVYLSVMSFIWLSVMSFILSLWHVFHFVSMLWLSFCLYVIAFILSMCQPSLSVSMSWLSFCPCQPSLFVSISWLSFCLYVIRFFLSCLLSFFLPFCYVWMNILFSIKIGSISARIFQLWKSKKEF